MTVPAVATCGAIEVGLAVLAVYDDSHDDMPTVFRSGKDRRKRTGWDTVR